MKLSEKKAANIFLNLFVSFRIFSESSSAEPTHLMNHVPDNAKQNPRTLDGCNKVYGMGTTCC